MRRFNQLAIGIPIVLTAAIGVSACGNDVVVCNAANARTVSIDSTLWTYADKLDPHHTLDQGNLASAFAVMNGHAPTDTGVELGQSYLIPTQLSDCHAS